MAYSEAQKKATMKYAKNNYYLFQVKFPKEVESIVRDAGKDSINAYVLSAVYEKLEKDGYNVPEEYKK